MSVINLRVFYLAHPVAYTNLFCINHLLKMMAVEFVNFTFAFRVLNLSLKVLFLKLQLATIHCCYSSCKFATIGSQLSAEYRPTGYYNTSSLLWREGRRQTENRKQLLSVALLQ